MLVHILVRKNLNYSWIFYCFNIIYYTEISFRKNGFEGIWDFGWIVSLSLDKNINKTPINAKSFFTGKRPFPGPLSFILFIYFVIPHHHSNIYICLSVSLVEYKFSIFSILNKLFIIWINNFIKILFCLH